MGSYFSNVLVQTSDEVDLEAISVAVERIVEAGGWKKANADASSVQRGVLLVPASGWVAVYDQGTEGGDTEALQQWGADLSSFLDTAAVTAIVSASDNLLLEVFKQGESEGFAERWPGGANLNEGGFGTWRSVFPGLDRQLAAAALKKDQTFVEDNLRALATLLGLPLDAICTGFKYSMQAPRPAGARLLTFVPVAEDVASEPLVEPIYAEDVHIGGPLPVVWSITFRNHGAGFRGVAVDVEQSDGLLLLTAVKVNCNGITLEQTLEPALSLSESRTLTFAELEVPEGMSPEALARLKSVGFGEWSKKAMPALITVDFSLVRAQPGDGDLSAAARPVDGEAVDAHQVLCTVR